MAKSQPERKIAPATLKVLLHYYYSPESYPEASPAVMAAFDLLVQDALLEGVDPLNRKPGGSNLIISERGRAYVERILATPLPVAVTTWVFE